MKIFSAIISCMFIVIIVYAQPDLSKTKIYSLKNYQLEISPDISPKLSWDFLSRSVLENAKVKNYLAHSKYMVLSQQVLPVDNGYNQYLVTIYDYTNNICLLIKANTNTVTEVTQTSVQPDPSEEEFEMALKLALQSDEKINAAYIQKTIAIYKPMPPLDMTQVADGKVQRTVTIGLESGNGATKNEIVGVNMITGRVIHYPAGAPPTSRANDKTCGIDNANQKTTHRMPDGSMWFSVKSHGIEIWKFMVTRPAASSGLNASGVELQYVSYMGKSVLRRAHVPVLNVKYDNDACGPYRDWLYQEGAFHAKGDSVAPGFVICKKPPTTLLESLSDTGNFRGVAIYATDSDFALTSEMNAGWYRYIMEWHFHPDGTIEPKFEFSAVKNSCVCNIHHHHVYWRFDFDIETPGKNQMAEYNKRSGWRDIDTEQTRLKDSAEQREWRISNTETGAAYIIQPGPNDGVADKEFGIADLWVLHDNGKTEIDDGIKQSQGPKKAQLNKYLNGENTHSTNIVVWYGAHFTHDVSETVDHEVGPRLICTNWTGATIATNQSLKKYVAGSIK